MIAVLMAMEDVMDSHSIATDVVDAVLLSRLLLQDVVVGVAVVETALTLVEDEVVVIEQKVAGKHREEVDYCVVHEDDAVVGADMDIGFDCLCLVGDNVEVVLD